jgi:hypothetical protein
MEAEKAQSGSFRQRVIPARLQRIVEAPDSRKSGFGSLQGKIHEVELRERINDLWESLPWCAWW